MKLVNIVKRINGIVGNGNYAFKDVVDYMDECVDEINVEFSKNLPLFSMVYDNTFIKLETELPEDYTVNSLENDYKRIPDEFIRNYICYEVAYRKLRDEDEAEEVYAPKQVHAFKWFEKMRALYSDFKMEHTEAITMFGDVRTDDVADEDRVAPPLFPI